MQTNRLSFHNKSTLARTCARRGLDCWIAPESRNEHTSLVSYAEHTGVVAQAGTRLVAEFLSSRELVARSSCFVACFVLGVAS
jgi:hypothetical protein